MHLHLSQSLVLVNQPSAYASKTELNKVSAPIKGNAGVYMIQVYNQEKSAEKV